MVVGIEITVITIAYILLANLIQRKLVNPRRLAELQYLIKTKTKELNELHKSNASPEAKKAKADELNAHFMENMRHSFRPMIVMFPFFIIVYYVLLPYAFPSNPNVTIPILAMTLDYKLYFIYASVVFGILLSLLLQRYDRKKMLEEKQQQPAAQ